MWKMVTIAVAVSMNEYLEKKDIDRQVKGF